MTNAMLNNYWCYFISPINPLKHKQKWQTNYRMEWNTTIRKSTSLQQMTSDFNNSHCFFILRFFCVWILWIVQIKLLKLCKKSCKNAL